MFAKLWHPVSTIGLLLIYLSLVSSDATTAQEIFRQAESVPQIYFGIIEPPVVAQQDITVRAPASNQQLEEKALECSSFAWVDGNLLISSDRHNHLLFSCPVDLESMTVSKPTPHVLIRNEQELLEDIECMTIVREDGGRTFVYMMCSQSNDPSAQPLPKRRHAIRFRLRSVEPFSFRRPVILNAGVVRDSVNDYFKDVGIEPYHTFDASFTGIDKNTYRWGNVEGMCFTPDSATLLLGMRNPLCASRAIVVAVTAVSEAFEEKNPNKMQIADLFTLNLGDRGISDLCWDPLTSGYLITAAKSNGPKHSEDQPFPPNTLDSALFWWSGRKNEEPILFARLPDMKIEAVCRLGETQFIAVGSDEGDLSEGRIRQQQSIVTIIHFTGIRLKTNNGRPS